jgi:hypothetical protein
VKQRDCELASQNRRRAKSKKPAGRELDGVVVDHLAMKKFYRYRYEKQDKNPCQYPFTEIVGVHGHVSPEPARL